MARSRSTRPAKEGDAVSTGRANGGEENPGAITGDGPISGEGPGESDTGNREAVPAAQLDRVFTAASKDTWDADQPTLSDALADRQRNADRVAGVKRKKPAKGEEE